MNARRPLTDLQLRVPRLQTAAAEVPRMGKLARKLLVTSPGDYVVYTSSKAGEQALNRLQALGLVEGNGRARKRTHLGAQVARAILEGVG